MKKLSDIKDEKAIVVVAQLLEPIRPIVPTPKMASLRTNGTASRCSPAFLPTPPSL